MAKAAKVTKPKVDVMLCVGCGLCEQLAADAFKIENGVSKVQKYEPSRSMTESIEEAANCCPVSAISCR